MANTMCPGQDTAFWRPGDVYEVPCSECGHEVEFFKDDATRRCTKCGHLLRNPKLNLGCAMWCEHAKECLGYDPKETMAQAEGGDASLVDKLIEILKREAAGDHDQVSRGLELLETVKRIMLDSGAEPRVVLSAAVLAPLTPEQALAAMKEIGLDETTRDRVSEILANLNQGAEPQGPEAKLLSDAALLADMQSARKLGGGKQSAPPLEAFLTASGRVMAQNIIAAP